MSNVLFCDGHDNAFVGFMWRFGQNEPIAAYSQKKIIENLMADGMTFDEAQGYFEFNIIIFYNFFFTKSIRRTI